MPVRVLSKSRNTQLDGWRAFAVLGVMWLHWTPRGWHGGLPFEVGLYFFLTLTGFLITRILLWERGAGEASGHAWRWTAFAVFQWRRALRILIPCLVAILFAWVVGAEDLRKHPLPYLAQVVNFHIALLPEWPAGTAHYWTLAIQQQFYLLWPLAVFLAPRRALGLVFAGFTLLAPLSRWVLLHYFPQVMHPEMIPSSAFDYFGLGALLALALSRGMPAGDRRLGIPAWLGLAGYVALYVLDKSGRPVPGLRHFQQMLLALAFAGLISATLRGLGGPLGRMLEHSWAQHIGRLSYGLYLFHNAVPLALGKVLPWLWLPVFNGPLLAIRLLVFALASWGLAWLSWRWLEQPMDRLRAKV